MADVLKRLAGPLFLTGSAATIYTSPATGAVVRAIRLNNETGTAATVTMSIGTDAAGKRIIGPGYSVPANGHYDFSGMLCLGNAEIIQALSGTASAVTVTLSGVET